MKSGFWPNHQAPDRSLENVNRHQPAPNPTHPGSGAKVCGPVLQQSLRGRGKDSDAKTFGERTRRTVVPRLGSYTFNFLATSNFCCGFQSQGFSFPRGAISQTLTCFTLSCPPTKPGKFLWELLTHSTSSDVSPEKTTEACTSGAPFNRFNISHRTAGEDAWHRKGPLSEAVARVSLWE